MKLYSAPLAGISHSAFRRLLSDYGGYDYLFTEMLSVRALLNENIFDSPYTKKRTREGRVIYQLMINANQIDLLPAIVETLSALDPWGIDINLGCPAPAARQRGCGVRLFEDLNSVELILRTIRRYWSKNLSVKCRLGSRKSDWKPHFMRFLDLMEDSAVDSITLHPRFREDKLRGRVCERAYGDFFSTRSLSCVGNGNITDATDFTDSRYAALSGFMIGRAAVCKPWIFKKIKDGCSEKELDFFHIWHTFCTYVLEDFPEEKALGRIKQFTSYFCQNFTFAHTLYSASMGSKSLPELIRKAEDFFTGTPPRVSTLDIREY
jgi:tRNA-dihydrouridine synthase